jgi:hypothetical protein
MEPLVLDQDLGQLGEDTLCLLHHLVEQRYRTNGLWMRPDYFSREIVS